MLAKFYQFEPSSKQVDGRPMNTIIKRPLGVIRAVARILGSLALLGVSLFCVFGFLASFEPGNGVEFKLVYGVLGCGCLSGAVILILGLFLPKSNVK